MWYAYCNNNPMKFTDPTGMIATHGSTKDDEEETKKADEEKEKKPSGSGKKKDGAEEKSEEENIYDREQELRELKEENDKYLTKLQNYEHFGLDPDSLKEVPVPQTPFDENDEHCDINSWNQAKDQGLDPTPPGGTAWNGNDLTVDEISKLYPNKTDAPLEGTKGFGFIDNDGNKVTKEHMMFYDNTDSDPNTYNAYDSNGIDDQTKKTWSMNGETVRNGSFYAITEEWW